jgi:hypothetical protein
MKKAGLTFLKDNDKLWKIYNIYQITTIQKIS